MSTTNSLGLIKTAITEKVSVMLNNNNANWDRFLTVIGNLSSLATTEKGSLVGAINENASEIQANADDIAELQTAVNKLNYTVIKSNISFGNVTSGTAVIAAYPSGVTYEKIISATFKNTGGSGNYDFSVPMCSINGIRFKPTVTQSGAASSAIFIVAD